MSGLPSQNLVDSFGRKITYARFSVTTACNFACSYCQEQPSALPADSLEYGEILRLASILAKLGVTKFRFTGGEPFLRPGFMDFLADFAREHGQFDIRLTTNGSCIQNYAETLARLKIGVNFSLDTFTPSVFATLTRTSETVFFSVMEALQALLACQVPIKINAVAMRGINRQELPAFLDFAMQHAVDVRFIEPMPFGPPQKTEAAWTGEEILADAQQYLRLIPLASHYGTDGPARVFALQNAKGQNGKGRFGLITPLSQHFCATCNRLRIRHNGDMRLCLYSEKEIRLAPLLHHSKITDARLARVIQQAVKAKPMGNMLNTPLCHTGLVKIGG